LTKIAIVCTSFDVMKLFSTSSVVLVVLMFAVASVAQEEAKPIPPWVPSGDGFASRIEAIKKLVQEQNPDHDPRVDLNILLASARSGGKRSWLDHSEWTDGRVRFAVGKVTDYQDGQNALTAAVQDAKAKLGAPAAGGGDATRALDWFISDEGIAYVLAGCWAAAADSGPKQP
jgi:hypothetical protein